MSRFTALGVRLSPNGANLRYSSPVPLAPELRELIVSHKAEIITALSVWCPKRAAALEYETDTLVAELSAGNDPVIAEAAARCVEAHAREDMAIVRAACHEIEDRARKLVQIETQNH